ncbi:MAG: hypothetical protein KDE68_02300 [Rhodocyclaceae bacterium]|nr:hypothetical protein [Rhodocyclaceae bacterium]
MPFSRFSLPAGAIALLCASAALALSTDHGASRQTEFLCDNGERLTLYTHDATLRLRTGAGVFALHVERENQLHGVDLRLERDGDALRLHRADAVRPIACASISRHT